MISQIAHIPWYQQDPRCSVVAISDSRPSLMKALEDSFGADNVVPDFHTFLARTDIDAVVISAPRAATGPLTLAALEAGKHVLAEKPMAHTADQARRLVAAASARGLTYAVGFMKRYDPGVHAAKLLFDSVQADGRLGRLLFARFYDYANAYALAPPPHTRPKESRVDRFPVWPLTPDWLPERCRATYTWFLNAGSHDVNLMRYFFREPLEVKSAHAQDGCVAALLHDSSCPIELVVVKAEAGRWLEGAEFVFERGGITLSIPSPMAVDAVTEVVLDDPARGISAARQAPGAGWSFVHQASGFVDALFGVAKPRTDGVEGLADLEVCEQIWRKAAGIS